MNIETAKKIKDLILEQIELQESLNYLTKQSSNKDLLGLYITIKSGMNDQLLREIPLKAKAMNIMLNSSIKDITNRIEEIDNQIKQL